MRNVLVLFAVLASGCAGRFDLGPPPVQPRALPPSELVTFDVDALERAEDVDDQIVAAYATCIQTRDALQRAAAEALDQRDGIHRLIAGITGLVVTIGSVVTAGAVFSADAPPAGESPDSTPAWVAIVTGSLGILGTSIVTFTSPGQRVLDLTQERAEDVRGLLDDVREFLTANPGPAAWNDGQRIQWLELVGRVGGECRNAGQNL